MKDCLVSFSSVGRENYNEKLLRLLDSALFHWKGDYIIHSPDHELREYKGIQINKGYPINSFTHKDMPYQFKIALIQQARDMGYERIVWLDSSMIIKRDIRELFGETGIGVFENIGHPLYKYISDKAVDLLGLTEPELKEIPQIWGGALFFDFTKPNVNEVFERIVEFSENGSFKDGLSTRDGFIAHRHDQAVISALAHNKCDLHPYGKIVCPPHHITLEYGSDFYLACI